MEEIEKATQRIDADTTLKIQEFDLTDIHERTYDGRGIITVYEGDKGVRKIYQEIGVSYGRVTLIVYLENGVPIKIIDREENFKWRADQAIWDQSELRLVFQEDIYVFNWEMDQNETVRKGQRNLSEGVCSIFEYKPFVEFGKELVEQ